MSEIFDRQLGGRGRYNPAAARDESAALLQAFSPLLPLRREQAHVAYTASVCHLTHGHMQR